MGEMKFMTKIPPQLLLSIEGYVDYSPQSLNQIKNAYNSYGELLLSQYPLIVCALPASGDNLSDTVQLETPYILPIIDGNHRFRIGKTMFIQQYPSKIYSIYQAKLFFQHRGLINETYNTLSEWIKQGANDHIIKYNRVIFQQIDNEILPVMVNE